MTNCAPFRAGTPKLSAAGPDRNVTTPSLKVSCADADAARPSDMAAADAITTIRLARRKRFMIPSLMSAGVPARLSSPFYTAPALIGVRLGKFLQRVNMCPLGRGRSRGRVNATFGAALNPNPRHGADRRRRPAAPLHRQADEGEPTLAEQCF